MTQKGDILLSFPAGGVSIVCTYRQLAGGGVVQRAEVVVEESVVSVYRARAGETLRFSPWRSGSAPPQRQRAIALRFTRAPPRRPAASVSTFRPPKVLLKHPSVIIITLVFCNFTIFVQTIRLLFDPTVKVSKVSQRRSFELFYIYV